MLYAAFGRLLVKSDGVPYHINDADFDRILRYQETGFFFALRGSQYEIDKQLEYVEAKRPIEPVLNVS